MSRARWWVVAVLGLVTVTVVTLDATGHIFGSEPAVVPPPALVFDEALVVEPALHPVDPTLVTSLPPRVERKVTRLLKSKTLGPRVSATVEGSTGNVMVGLNQTVAATPASTLKLLTALSVLTSMDPTTRIATQVVRGETPRDLVLVGGGDATLTVAPSRGSDPPSASLAALARITSKSVGEGPVHISYDDSLFTGPAVSPSWESTYVSSGVIAPVTALMADQGLVSEGSLARYPNPAAAAATDFARLLSQDGVKVQGVPKASTASAMGDPVATVQSPPVDSLVERMLRDSDNQLAESLGRLAALERGLPASFDGAAAAIGRAAESQGIAVDSNQLYDASGLSRDDRVPAAALADVLQTAVNDSDLRPITLGLPVAGFSGTLADRYLTPPQSAAAGIVRAKTGTLTGVSAESGVTVTCDGTLVVFAFLADRVPYDTDAARSSLDKAAAALASCH